MSVLDGFRDRWPGLFAAVRRLWHRSGWSGREQNAALAALIRRERLLPRDPLLIVDVGARHGPARRWGGLEPVLRWVGFEPDRDEAARLASRLRRLGVRAEVHPTVIADRERTVTFQQARFPDSSSIVAADPRFLARLYPVIRQTLSVVGTCELPAMSLDRFCAERGIDRIDLLKIDVEGAEDLVLAGADRMLREGRILAIDTEVWSGPLKHAPGLFAIGARLERLGMPLYDLTLRRYPRDTLPRGVIRRRGKLGGFFCDSTAIGQMLTGDALFMRDPIGEAAGPAQPCEAPLTEPPPLALDDPTTLKLALICHGYGLPDCALELLDHRAGHPDCRLPVAALATALLPRHPDGRRLDRVSYMQAADSLPWPEMAFFAARFRR